MRARAGIASVQGRRSTRLQQAANAPRQGRAWCKGRETRDEGRLAMEPAEDIAYARRYRTYRTILFGTFDTFGDIFTDSGSNGGVLMSPTLREILSSGVTLDVVGPGRIKAI